MNLAFVVVPVTGSWLRSSKPVALSGDYRQTDRQRQEEQSTNGIIIRNSWSTNFADDFYFEDISSVNETRDMWFLINRIKPLLSVSWSFSCVWATSFSVSWTSYIRNYSSLKRAEWFLFISILVWISTDMFILMLKRILHGNSLQSLASHSV